MYKNWESLHHRIQHHLRDVAGTYSLAVSLPDDGRKFSYDTRIMPSASLIKVFIMAEAFRQASAGCLQLTHSLAVTSDVQVGGAGPLEHAALGTRLSVQELVELMIVESDNTATNILIKLLGMDSINTLARDLGCHHSSLNRRMMDFESRAAGADNYTSPTDMNILLGLLYAGKCVNKASDQAMIDILLRQTDKCKLPLLLPQGITIAHKTGELDGIEHDSGIVFAQTPYIITIMTVDLPDEELGRKTIAELSQIVYDTLNE